MHISQFVSAVSPVFTAPLLWVGQLFAAITGALEFYLSCFVFALVVSMFIAPLRGAALSGAEATSKSTSKSKSKPKKEEKSSG